MGAAPEKSISSSDFSLCLLQHWGNIHGEIIVVKNLARASLGGTTGSQTAGGSDVAWGFTLPCSCVSF